MPIVPCPAMTSGSSYGAMNVRPCSARRRWASAFATSKVSPQRTISAPSACTASTLISGVVVGITMTARMPEAPGRERDALGMVAGRRGDDAAGGLLRAERGYLVVGAADLEREDAVEVLPLEEDLVAEALRQARSPLERRLRHDVVDAGLEDTFDVGSHGGAGGCPRPDY